jgi:hypothetical protein
MYALSRSSINHCTGQAESPLILFNQNMHIEQEQHQPQLRTSDKPINPRLCSKHVHRVEAASTTAQDKWQAH